jgi:hypothetical protein
MPHCLTPRLSYRPLAFQTRSLVRCALMVLMLTVPAKARVLPVANLAAGLDAQGEQVRWLCEWHWSAYRLRPRCYWVPRWGLYPRFPMNRPWYKELRPW